MTEDPRHSAATAMSTRAGSSQMDVHFHPDWPYQGGTVIESMVKQGTYRSQFVTGISNGGLTAFKDGDRWRWESRLFEGRYDTAPASTRPIYGAWNRHNDPYGAAIRFGSAHLRLLPEVAARSTFCFPDSVFEPSDSGGPDLLPHLCRLADAATHDDLDDYVEAHVHGEVRFDADVEALVLDPCFAGTIIEEQAHLLGCPVEFHNGFRATPDLFDPDYRGSRRILAM